MNYELAKQLKDAGFTQMGDGSVLMLHNPEHFEDKEDQTMSTMSYERYVYTNPGARNKYGQDLYSPTLSELIEACGDDFASLSYYKEEELPWRAFGNGYPVTTRGQGSTPEEAVAKLWLELQKC